MNKNRWFLWVGLTACLLLIASFPVKYLIGREWCTAMRIAGFLLLIFHTLSYLFDQAGEKLK